MLIEGIKSRPVGRPLQPDAGGRYHLLVGGGSGGEALLRLLAAMPAGADLHVIYTPAICSAQSSSGSDWSGPLRASGVTDVRLFANEPDAVVELDCTLAGCVMGTRLYVAGPESFVGVSLQAAAKYNLNADEIQFEHCGSAVRRVYCIHCKALNENVSTSIVRCTGCGRHLLVRDHYSRRLAAYMGVMADAEAPGELPPIEEAFA